MRRRALVVLLGLALLAAGAGWASGLGRCRAEDACWVVVPGHAGRRPAEGVAS